MNRSVYVRAMDLIEKDSRTVMTMKIIRSIFRPHPAYLYLEPFFGCNFKCPFCFYLPDQNVKTMQLEPAIIEKLLPVIENVRHVHITGLGEPFLNPHLLDYLKLLREKNKSYYINTNGSLIQESHLEVMANSRCELSISIDAGDRRTYQKVRHPAKWDVVMATLSRVQEMKAGLANAYPRVYATVTINMLNLESLVKLPALCRAKCIEAVRLSWTILPKSYARYCVFDHQEKATRIIRSVVKKLNDMGVAVKNSAEFDTHDHTCWDLTGFTYVGSDGAVTACPNRWIHLGSLHENTFEDIWNGMPHRKIGFGVFNGNPEDSCKTCRLIRRINYRTDKHNFFRQEETDEIFLREKSKPVEKLPSLNGLDREFQKGVMALFNKNLQQGIDIFLQLEKRFPDFFEIKNNLAVAYAYLGNKEKSLQLQQQIEQMPHFER